MPTWASSRAHVICPVEAVFSATFGRDNLWFLTRGGGTMTKSRLSGFPVGVHAPSRSCQGRSRPAAGRSGCGLRRVSGRPRVCEVVGGPPLVPDGGPERLAGRAGTGRRGPGRAGRGPFLGRPSRPGKLPGQGNVAQAAPGLSPRDRRAARAGRRPPHRGGRAAA